MGLTETLVFYLVIGLSIAVAVWAGDEKRPRTARSYRAMTAVIFWPVYLPILLTPATAGEEPPKGSDEPRPDELSLKINGLRARGGVCEPRRLGRAGPRARPCPDRGAAGRVELAGRPHPPDG